MQKNSVLLASLCLVLFFSCSKFELIKDHFDEPQQGDSKNDYAVVKTDSLFLMGTETIRPFLFKKTYDNNQRIKKIDFTFRHYAMWIYVDEVNTFDVKYSAKQIDIISSGNDTIASIKLNNNGKPVHAKAYRSMYTSEAKYDYNFFYSGGKLSEIRTNEDGPDRVYAKIEYETGKNNLKAVSLYYSEISPTRDRITYSYDYSKKAKAQYYGDESNHANFWTFLKYMNIFDELHSENLLVSSYFKTDEYPGDIVRNYQKHKFDSYGRVTSYEASESMVIYGSIAPYKQWKVDWR